FLMEADVIFELGFPQCCRADRLSFYYDCLPSVLARAGNFFPDSQVVRIVIIQNPYPEIFRMAFSRSIGLIGGSSRYVAMISAIRVVDTFRPYHSRAYRSKHAVKRSSGTLLKIFKACISSRIENPSVLISYSIGVIP